MIHNSSLLGKYQKSYYEKKTAPLIALDVGTIYHQNFLGYRSVVDGKVCKYIYLATGIIEKGITFNLRPCNTLFPKFWTYFSWSILLSCHICLCLCLKWILKLPYIHWSKIILHVSNLLGKSGKMWHEKRLSALRLHSTWINYSIKYSLGIGAQLML